MFTNLVETDMLWGHRNDPVNFHRCLQDFDRRLPDLLDALREGDLLILTSDHGCDPTTPSTDHSREHALLLAYVQGRNAAGRVYEGGEFADVGATVNAWLGGSEPARGRRPGKPIVDAVISAAELIQRKRDGHELSAESRSASSCSATRAARCPDYQMAAFCMAVYFRGLSSRETFALTDAMIRSGETIDLGAALGRKVVDKHSTGGVGDKTSLAVGPIVAACGVPFGKMSGRGLGHTGGHARQARVDPGLPRRSHDRRVHRAGHATSGSRSSARPPTLVPADLALYALRDVTATVDQLSLIAASIMSKKLAGRRAGDRARRQGRDGAFMKTLDDARALAEAMLALGQEAGREVVCLLTDMDQPLGAAVGNALEVREALATVRGQGPAGLHRARARRVCARLLALSDLGIDVGGGRAAGRGGRRRRLRRAGLEPLARGAGRHRRRVGARRAPVVREVTASRAGHVERLDAIQVGMAALHLGAGRAREGRRDRPRGRRRLPAQARRRGSRRASVLAEVHARDEATAARPSREVAAAYELGDEPRARATGPARGRRLAHASRSPVGELDGSPCLAFARRQTSTGPPRPRARAPASVSRCPSCPRSRPSAGASRPCSRGGGSSASRSRTRG